MSLESDGPAARPSADSSASSTSQPAPEGDLESEPLARSIADGESIDWDAEEERRRDPAGRLEGYRAVASVAEAFRSIRSGDGEEETTEPGGEEAGGDEALGSWGDLELRRVLGRGGFGTVYEAFDPGLHREVALKLHSASFAEGSRGDRFLDEARRLAKVRHPNVLTVHGAAVHEGRPGLWADLVRGKTLREWVSDNGPMGPAEAVSVGVDVCRALAAIHRAGLIHGDVKPSNVMREVGGRVVLMDFGAARNHERDTDEPVEGTPAVVAPEVLEGERPATASDLYSVGVLLYFLLTGQFPLQEETFRSVRDAHDSGRRSPLNDVRSDLPRALVEVVEVAMESDPEDRFQTAGEMERALSGAVGHRVDVADRDESRHPILRGIAVGLVLGAVLTLLIVTRIDLEAGPADPIRFTVVGSGAALSAGAQDSLEFGGPLAVNLAVHPDGRSWVVRSRGPEGPRLVARDLGSDEVREISETEDGSHPFWSPDGSSLGFVVGTTIRRVDPSTGVARTVLPVEGARLFGTPSWGRDGSILYATTGGGVQLVSAEGGEAREVLALEDIPGASFLGWPRHLPDGDHFLVLAGGVGPGGTQLFVASLKGEAPVPLPGIGSRALFVEPETLLYGKRDRLLAQRFDPEDLELRGEPLGLIDGVSVRVRTGEAAFAASPDLLVVGRSQFWSRMQWYARDGTPLEQVGEPGDLYRARLSPSGDRIAFPFAEVSGGVEDLWVFDLERDVGSRLTATPAEEGTPTWSPDGERLAYFSDAGGPPDLWIRSAHPGGEETVLVQGPVVFSPRDWSPDGETILFEHGFGSGADLWLAPLDGSPPRPWLEGPGEQTDGRYSPDGRWIAFTSAETGTSEIFVAPVEDAARRARVSTMGGGSPAWAPSGDEIFYRAGRTLLRSAFDPETGRPLGRPELLFRLDPPDRLGTIEVAPSGDRFLLTITDEDRLRPRTTVQVGWQRGLWERP